MRLGLFTHAVETHTKNDEHYLCAHVGLMSGRETEINDRFWLALDGHCGGLTCPLYMRMARVRISSLPHSKLMIIRKSAHAKRAHAFECFNSMVRAEK